MSNEDIQDIINIRAEAIEEEILHHDSDLIEGLIRDNADAIQEYYFNYKTNQLKPTALCTLEFGEKVAGLINHLLECEAEDQSRGEYNV